MGSLLDETITWSEFGKRYLDRRVSKAVTGTLGLERPTLVQSRGIPVALEGKDLLCRARTGSGKTLCYSVPLIQRLLADSEASGGCLAPLRGIVLVPTKELVAQVHSVIVSLLAFCFDVISAAALLSGEKYMKAELPTILVTTPSSLISLVKQRSNSMQPLASSLRVLIIDEADLMFSFGYEDDMRALCALMPSTYQAMLFSATLSEEVEQLKGLMLHKPVVLKLEEPRVTGQLSQFHMKCHKDDKSLILYTLLKLQLISGKTLMFVKSVEAAYRMKILLERFSINCAVLNADLPHKTRQDIIQAFNQSLVELLVATDSGFADESDKEDDSEAEDDDDAEEGGESEMDGEDEDEESEEEEEEPAPPPKRRRKLGKKAVKEAAKAEAEAKAAAETAAFEAAAEAAVVKAKKGKKGKKGKKAAAEEEEEEPALATVSISVPEAQDKSSKRQQRSSADAQYSLVRGVDLKDVSTVINADMPATVRDYVHRVGRCARGGSSGTALTLCCTDDPLEEARLRRIVRYISSTSAPEHALKELPMQMSDAERFRYRVEDMSRGLTKKVVAQYRARELQMEALNSEKLQSYFEDHPEEKKALQKSQRALKEKKSIRQHLKHIPFYLVPEQFVAATPVQQAVRDEAAKNGGKVPSSVKRKRYLHAQKQDPLQSCEASLKGKRKRNLRFTREAMEAKERRIDPKTANVEDLPPMSGRKLWKLRHGKSVRKKTDQFGERRRMTYGQKRRAGKFAVN